MQKPLYSEDGWRCCVSMNFIMIRCVMYELCFMISGGVILHFFSMGVDYARMAGPKNSKNFDDENADCFPSDPNWIVVVGKQKSLEAARAFLRGRPDVDMDRITFVVTGVRRNDQDPEDWLRAAAKGGRAPSPGHVADSHHDLRRI
jgi:hypothetical protein